MTIETVFFSYHFEEDPELVRMISKCVERQGLQIVTGERLGGGEIPTAVKDRIGKADSLIALMTRRYKIGAPEMQLWDTYPWVRDEITYAYQLGKPAIAVVESGVEVAGAFSNYERIALDRDRRDSATDALRQTLLLWTGKLGARPMKVHLAAEHLRQLGPDKWLCCRYRWWLPPDGPQEWERADIVHMAGDLYFLARRPADSGALIQIEVLEGGKPKWCSGWELSEVFVRLVRAGE